MPFFEQIHRHLTDGLRVDDDNILYTFHFYEGAWLGNTMGEKRSGTSDWTNVSMQIEVPENASGFNIMLRSDDNKGTAYFDDVTLSDASGKVLCHFNFDKGTAPLSVERAPHQNGSYDAAAGHDKPGCLRIGGTTSYNSWRTPEYDLKPGTYTLSACVKLDNATGGTYLCAAMFGSEKYTVEDFDKLLKPGIEFSKKYHVPLLIGEFSIGRRNARELQGPAIADRIAAFEKNGMSWTYWNFRETTGPDSMALQAQKKSGGDFPINAPLLEALKKGWADNH